MRKRHHNSARASALQIILALGFSLVAAILLATSFSAAPSVPNDQTQIATQDPTRTASEETEAPAVIGTCDTAGPVEVEATAGTLGPTAYPNLAAAIAALNAGTPNGAHNDEYFAH